MKLYPYRQTTPSKKRIIMYLRTLKQIEVSPLTVKGLEKWTQLAYLHFFRACALLKKPQSLCKNSKPH